LHEVFRGRLVPQEVVENAQQPVLIPSHQLPEGVVIAGLGAQHQLYVRIAEKYRPLRAARSRGTQGLYPRPIVQGIEPHLNSKVSLFWRERKVQPADFSFSSARS